MNSEAGNFYLLQGPDLVVGAQVLIVAPDELMETLKPRCINPSVAEAMLQNLN